MAEINITHTMLLGSVYTPERLALSISLYCLQFPAHITIIIILYTHMYVCSYRLKHAASFTMLNFV